MAFAERQNSLKLSFMIFAHSHRSLFGTQMWRHLRDTGCRCAFTTNENTQHGFFFLLFSSFLFFNLICQIFKQLTNDKRQITSNLHYLARKVHKKKNNSSKKRISIGINLRWMRRKGILEVNFMQTVFENILNFFYRI